MILNTGVRTDTVQYFTPWLLKRFEEGYVLSRNPMFQQKVTRYELTPEKVDCMVFCSKNYKPILKDIVKITDKFNTYFYYTITAYGTGRTVNRRKYQNAKRIIKNCWKTALGMAIWPCAADWKIYNCKTFGDFWCYGKSDYTIYWPVYLQLCGNVQKTSSEHAGADSNGRRR